MSSVLIVDDHADTCRALAMLLRRTGHAADCLTDPRLAIDAMRASRPDLLILDVMMPHMNGVDVLRVIRSEPGLRSLPVVMFSGAWDDQYRRETEALGVQGYVVKGGAGWMTLWATMGPYLAAGGSPHDA